MFEITPTKDIHVLVLETLQPYLVWKKGWSFTVIIKNLEMDSFLDCLGGL